MKQDAAKERNPRDKAARPDRPRGLREREDMLPDGRRIAGWKEWVALPQLGLPHVLAKLDTGARTSALHTTRRTLFQRDGALWVDFDVDGQAEAGGTLTHQARVLDQRAVKSSSGHVEHRTVIRTVLKLGPARWPIEVSLTDRSDMEVPMLIGRAALKRRILVDPRDVFVLSRRPRRALAR